MAAEKIMPGEPWFAVKCLFSHPSRKSDGEPVLYEERITLWRAASWDEAFRLAEAEAQQYASGEDCMFHFATDAFHLFDEAIAHGTEVWSTMRGSGMDPETYKHTFCATPRDRIGDHR